MRGVGADLHKKQVFKSFELEKKTKNFLHVLKAQKPPDKKKNDICDKSAQTQTNPVFLAFIRLLFPQRSPGSVQRV